MANDLTGDFDVVVEFAIPAANRVLAAMHGIERFPHSAAFHVDDTQPPAPNFDTNSIIEVVDGFGDPIVDHNNVGPVNPLPGQLVATSPVYAGLGALVNADSLVAVEGTITPSLLKGRAQLQIGPPTMELVPGSATNIRVLMHIIARYFADPGTAALAEFVRGDLALTAGVNQVASQAANVLDIGLKAANVGVSFTSTWSSQPLSAEDLAGINLLIRNALKNSMLPSNVTLPPAIKFLQLKALSGSQSAIAALLNLTRPAPDTSTAGNPASVQDVFLGSADQFALAVSRDFILAAFNPLISNILSQSIDPIHIDVPLLVTTVHATYTITLNSASIDLLAGKITLTIKGRAHTPTSYLPDFDFTIQQDFTLTANGDSADLTVGDISLDTSSWVVNAFKGGALDAIKPLRDSAIEQTHARDTVRAMLSATANLGGLFDSLLTPARPNRIPAHQFHGFQSHDFQLTYTSAEIRPAGIVLHGAMAVTAWAPAHVEFEPIPTTESGSDPAGLASDLYSSEPDYSALKSWIPGGDIQRYEWTRLGQTQPDVDENRFIHFRPGIVATGPGAVAFSAPVTAYTPLCLTMRGTRLSSSGPVVAESISGSVCGFSSVAVVQDVGALGAARPLITLTQPGPRGLVEITGHAAAVSDRTGRDAPNRIVHFADATTADLLGVLTDALREGRRDGAVAAVLAVISPDLLMRTRFTPGIIYVEDRDGIWERTLGLKTVRRPLTVIVEPKGAIAWQHEGPLERATLVAAFRRYLVVAGPVRLPLLRLTLRIGQPAPDFLFEAAPGRQLTLHKLVGRRVCLAFWNSSSKPSLDAVRMAQDDASKSGAPIVLAVNDGESPEAARRAAGANGISATVVIDPQRRITSAYGVNVWPTTVLIGESGAVQSIQYGLQTNGGHS
jgi:peroxiredoxin